MKVESELKSDLKDVDIADASNAAASDQAATQSLPSNRFDLEVCARILLFLCEIYRPLTFPLARIYPIISFPSIPPFPRHHRNTISIVFPRLFTLSSLLETARICEVFSISELSLFLRFIGTSR